MRIAWLIVGVCVVLSVAAVSPGEPLSVEQLKQLETLQKENVRPTKSDRAFMVSVCTQLIGEIMAPDLVKEADKKVAARVAAVEALLGGVGTAKGRVVDIFHDLAAEAFRDVLATQWSTLSKTDWLGRMSIMMIVADLNNGLMMTTLQAGMIDPNPAVRYHAVKGLARIRDEIAGSAVRAIARNRVAFLVVLKKQALAEPNGVVRRMLARVLLLQKSLPNPQNNVGVDLLLAVVTARLDVIKNKKQLVGIHGKGFFFERADVELTKALGLSLANEPDKATKTKLATELARTITYAARDYGRAGLPKHYRYLLVEILLAADDALVRCIPSAKRLLHTAMKEDALAQRRVKVQMAAIQWMLPTGPSGVFGVQPIPDVALPAYKTSAKPPIGPQVPDGGGELPDGGGLPD